MTQLHAGTWPRCILQPVVPVVRAAAGAGDVMAAAAGVLQQGSALRQRALRQRSIGQAGFAGVLQQVRRDFVNQSIRRVHGSGSCYLPHSI